MISIFGRFCLLAMLVAMTLAAGLAVSAGARAQPAPAAAPASSPANEPRYLVYFDEFSAYLSPQSKAIIARAAKRAKEVGAKSITVQARASATGTVETNKYLAETRSSIVTDQLAEDGIPRSLVEQQPIGQTGSHDPSVYNRRVDIIIKH
jgi:outer membrane protein OmpA-like peptidoglycan-associated protein